MQEPENNEWSLAPKSSGSRLKIILPVIAALIILAIVGVFVVKPMLGKKPEPSPASPVVAKKVLRPEPTTVVPKQQPPEPPPQVKEPQTPNCEAGQPPVKFDKKGVKTLIDRWADAWTRQDFRTYKSFYSKKFNGIKRTIRPITKHYRYKDWMQDRWEMLDYATWTKLEVKNLEFVCASDNEIKVKFTQVYRSTTYNDIGPKTITFAREEGKLKIIYEEMLEAHPI